MTKRRVFHLTVTLCLVLSSVVVTYLASRARTPIQRAASSHAPVSSVVTARAEEGPLIDSVTLEGTWTRELIFSVVGPAVSSGVTRQVVTKTPVKDGDHVTAGSVIAEVSGRPIIVLPGEFSSYRDLVKGDIGPDVRQLQTALRSLYGTPVTGTFDARTETDVRSLYRKAGYPVATAPTGGGGDSAGAPPAGGGSGGSSTSDKGQKAPQTPAQAPSVRVPVGEVLFVAALPLTVGAVNARVGGDGTGQLVTLVGGIWQIIVPVTSSTVRGFTPVSPSVTFSLANRGGGSATATAVRFVEVRTPRGSAGMAPGQVQGPSHQGQSGQSGQSGQGNQSGQGTGVVPGDSGGGRGGMEAVFVVDTPPANIHIGQPQDVTMEKGRSPHGCVVVPASALWTAGNGTISVTVIQADGSTVVVPVTVAVSAGGRVAIRPTSGSLPVGARVVVSSRDGGTTHG